MKYLFFLAICISTMFAQGLASDFDSSEAHRATEILPDSMREPIFAIFADAGGNWKALSSFVSAYEGEMREDAIWLINTMPHLDRILATRDILKEHLDYAYRAKKEAPWEIPDTMFRDFILAYRISYEPVTPWRKLLFERFFPEAKKIGTTVGSAKFVNQWISENLDTASYEFFGGMQSPDLTFRRRKGTPDEISALMTAIFKSLGIPSRNASMNIVRGTGSSMSWVEIFDPSQNDWIPLFPDAPERFGDYSYPSEKNPGGMTVVTVAGGFRYDRVTEKYAKIGFMKSSFTKGKKPAGKWEHFSITVQNNGAYFPLDELGTEADSQGIFIATLATGDYVLQNGYRDRTGSVWVQTNPFSIAENETTFLTIAVDAPEFIVPAEKPGIMPVFTLPDSSGNLFSHNQLLSDKPSVLFFFDPAGEPSIRAIPQIKNVFERWKEKANFIGVLIEYGEPKPYREIPFIVLLDRKGSLASTITKENDLQKLRNKKLPLILFVSGKNLEFETISEGYNLNIGNLLNERLERWDELQ